MGVISPCAIMGDISISRSWSWELLFTTFVAAVQMNNNNNKKTKLSSVWAEDSSPLTSAGAVLRAPAWPPGRILEEIPAPLAVGAICVVLADAPAMDLHRVTSKQW